MPTKKYRLCERGCGNAIPDHPRAHPVCEQCRDKAAKKRKYDIRRGKVSPNAHIKNDPRYKRPHAGLNGDAHRIVLNDGEVVTL